MQTLTLPQIGNMFDNGLECGVFDTDDPTIVFKLYKASFGSYEEVERIIELNREYTECSLAPQVYSNVIKIDYRYGYYAERILPQHLFPDSSIPHEDLFNKLAKQLGIDDYRICELYQNWGLTKDKRPVLFDFGLVSLRTLGLIPYEN